MQQAQPDLHPEAGRGPGTTGRNGACGRHRAWRGPVHSGLGDLLQPRDPVVWRDGRFSLASPFHCDPACPVRPESSPEAGPAVRRAEPCGNTDDFRDGADGRRSHRGIICLYNHSVLPGHPGEPVGQPPSTPPAFLGCAPRRGRRRYASLQWPAGWSGYDSMGRVGRAHVLVGASVLCAGFRRGFRFRWYSGNSGWNTSGCDSPCWSRSWRWPGDRIPADGGPSSPAESCSGSVRGSRSYLFSGMRCHGFLRPFPRCRSGAGCMPSSVGICRRCSAI